jgi:type II secretory pathway pseudopilin PulG
MNHFALKQNSGMSLVSVLISLAMMGVLSTVTFSWLANYQKGRSKLAILSSIGEVERVIASAIGQSIQSYVRKGCTNTALTTSGLSILNQKRTLTGFGDLTRITSKGQVTLTAPTPAQKAHTEAVAALGSCTAASPTTASGNKFSTCFVFKPEASAKAVASPSSILKSNFVFVSVESEILNLRDGASLSCAQVADKAGLMKCTITGGCKAYSESSFSGSGVKHHYKIFWETGSGASRNYSSKEGRIYVPN